MNNENHEVLLNYKLESSVVNYLLNVLNRTQVAGVEQAQSLIAVTKMLQEPLNKDEIEKAQYEELKDKFEKKK